MLQGKRESLAGHLAFLVSGHRSFTAPSFGRRRQIAWAAQTGCGRCEPRRMSTAGHGPSRGTRLAAPPIRLFGLSSELIGCCDNCLASPVVALPVCFLCLRPREEPRCQTLTQLLLALVSTTVLQYHSCPEDSMASTLVLFGAVDAQWPRYGTDSNYKHAPFAILPRQLLHDPMGFGWMLGQALLSKRLDLPLTALPACPTCPMTACRIASEAAPAHARLIGQLPFRRSFCLAMAQSWLSTRSFASVGVPRSRPRTSWVYRNNGMVVGVKHCVCNCGRII